jgi:hypothetical protein
MGAGTHEKRGGLPVFPFYGEGLGWGGKKMRRMGVGAASSPDEIKQEIWR